MTLHHQVYLFHVNPPVDVSPRMLLLDKQVAILDRVEFVFSDLIRTVSSIQFVHGHTSSESGLITVYLYIPETGPQNGVGWLLQKVIFPHLPVV